MPRVPLRNSDLIAGQPIKRDVFDPRSVILRARGTVVESEQGLAGRLQKYVAIANTEEPGFGGGYGLQFAEVSPENSLIISAFVFRQRAESQAT